MSWWYLPRHAPSRFQRTVVDDGAIPGLDLAQLRSDAARVVTRIAA
jgi:hypothetical protein